MSSASDTIGREIGAYYEKLSEGRRDLVWVRFERAAGAPIDDFDPHDERIDEVFDQVVEDMWCADHLDKLVELGRLVREVGTDGELRYRSPDTT